MSPTGHEGDTDREDDPGRDITATSTDRITGHELPLVMAQLRSTIAIDLQRLG